MNRPFKLLTAAALAGAALATSGCAVSRLHNSSDFGVSFRQDAAAQVADPDARYVGEAQPGGSNGPRVAAAEDRYDKGKVISPVPAQTSDISINIGSGGGAPSQ